ncbi:MAG: PaaI family thioesterase [Pseudomonadota bacterium]
MKTREIGSELEQGFRDRIFDRVNKIPIMSTMKLEVIDLKAGYCELKAPRQKMYDGIYDSFHGGLLMTVADSAAAFALMTLTGPEAKMTTTDMNIRFLAPCLTDLIVHAKVIKFGRTLSPMAIDLYDENEKYVAVAQVNYFVLGKI